MTANNSESDSYSFAERRSQQASRWLKVGIIAAASALAGGLAAAWWHRKILKTLRQTGENTINPHFGITTDEPPDEV